MAAITFLTDCSACDTETVASFQIACVAFLSKYYYNNIKDECAYPMICKGVYPMIWEHLANSYFLFTDWLKTIQGVGS